LATKTWVRFRFKDEPNGGTYSTIFSPGHTQVIEGGVWVDYENPDYDEQFEKVNKVAKTISVFIPFHSLVFLQKWEV